VASLRHPLTRTLVVLTFTSGLVDAASYLGLGHVFAANMTGNIVLLGFGIAGGAQLPVLAPVVSLGAFVLGAGLGGVLIRRLADRRTVHLTWALSIEIVTLVLAATIAAVVTVHTGGFSGDAIIAVLALGMGVRNATVRKFAVPDVNTTVLTMTITGFAVALPLFGGTGDGTLRRGAAVTGMLAGALTGALLVKTALAWPLVLGVVLAVTALASYRRAVA
jgi:uncharacterized membrane protein YoaK (UPF0700 family)